jgi:hypothetical protein
MKQLYEITRDPFFDQYHRKWEAPLKKPYLYRVFRDRNRSGILLFLLLGLVFWIVLTAASRLMKIQ